MIREMTVKVENRSGLHMRPAAVFAENAARFKAEIKLVKDGREANAKSLVSILTLGVEMGTAVTVRATGEDAEEAVNALVGLIRRQTG